MEYLRIFKAVLSKSPEQAFKRRRVGVSFPWHNESESDEVTEMHTGAQFEARDGSWHLVLCREGEAEDTVDPWIRRHPVAAGTTRE